MDDIKTIANSLQRLLIYNKYTSEIIKQHREILNIKTKNNQPSPSNTYESTYDIGLTYLIKNLTKSIIDINGFKLQPSAEYKFIPRNKTDLDHMVIHIAKKRIIIVDSINAGVT